MPGNSLIGSLAVNLTMETAAFQKGATIAEKRSETLRQRVGGAASSIKGMGAALGGLVGVSVLTGLVSDAFDLASALSEDAEKAGVTVEGLQRLRMAASQTGVENDQLAGSLAKLNKSLGDLQLGNAKTVKAFEALGLSAQQLRGMKTEDAFRLIAEQLSKIPDVQMRVAIGNQIFGKSFSQLLPLIDGGAKALDEYAAKSKAAGEISSADAARLDDLADTWDRLKTRVGVSTATMIARLSEAHDSTNTFLAGVQKWANDTDAAIVKWAQSTAQSFVNWHARVQAAFDGVRDSVIASVEGIYNGVKTWLVDKLGAIYESAKAKIQSVADKFKWMYDVVVGHSYVPDMVDQVGLHFGRLQGEMVDPTIDATDRAAQGFANMATSALNSVSSIINALKNHDWLSAIEQAINLLSQLGVFGGGSKAPSTDIGDFPTTGPIGMARGGSFRIGGMGGTDRNLLSLNGSPVARVSRGEWLGVSPNGGPGGRGGTTIVVNAQDAVLAETVKGWVAQGMQQAAAIGSADAIERIGAQKRRQLA